MKKLTGKEWFQRLETAFPGTLERVCRESGLRPGDDMDAHVSGVLQDLAEMTGGPELTSAMVGHARREYGIVRRAALPRAVPAQSLPLEESNGIREIADIAARDGFDVSVKLVPNDEADALDAKVTASLERILPQLLHRMYTGWDHRHPNTPTIAGEEAPHA